MRIPCPFCGVRDLTEFTYLGDASLTERPDPASPNAAVQFHEYVHLRDNPAGLHDELWYHGGGCRSWLTVTRNTRTHVIEGAKLTRTSKSWTATS
jgi:sarcosine oxidase subunit delta